MARFTIELPSELSGSDNRPGANGPARDCEDCEGLDDPTRRFVAWVECWAGA